MKAQTTTTHSKDFSAKTLKQLSNKDISIIGTQAVPGYDGDMFFSGVAYNLCYNGNGFLRTHSQVIVLAGSSWNPKTDL
jgi:hypothetical protein